MVKFGTRRPRKKSKRTEDSNIKNVEAQNETVDLPAEHQADSSVQRSTSSNQDHEQEESKSVSISLAVEINNDARGDRTTTDETAALVRQHSSKNIHSQQEDTSGGLKYKTSIYLEDLNSSTHHDKASTSMHNNMAIAHSQAKHVYRYDNDMVSDIRENPAIFETVLPSTSPNSEIAQAYTPSMTKSKKQLNDKQRVRGPKVSQAEKEDLNAKNAKRNSISFPAIRLFGNLGMIPLVCSIDEYWLSKLQEVVRRHQLKMIQEDSSVARQLPFDDFCPNGEVPKSFSNVDHETVIRFRASSETLNPVARVCREGMCTMAKSLYSESEDERYHLELLKPYDVRYCCRKFQIRSLLFKSKEMLRKVYKEEELDIQYRTIDFEARSERALDIMAIAFAGMIRVLQKGWSYRPPNTAFAITGKRYVYPALYEKVMCKLGGPRWTEEWCRILLFSCPAKEGMLEDDEDRVLYEVGINLEHLCLVQLIYILEADGAQITNAMAIANSTHHTQDDIKNEKADVCAEKQIPFPWNRVVHWTAEKKVLVNNEPSHKWYSKVITSGREFVKQRCDGVFLRVDQAEKCVPTIDLLVKSIISRGSQVMHVDEGEKSFEVPKPKRDDEEEKEEDEGFFLDPNMVLSQ